MEREETNEIRKNKTKLSIVKNHIIVFQTFILTNEINLINMVI